jgi:hypothetical protein
MSIYISVRDNVGKIVFTIGVVLVIAGVLTLNLYGSLLSAGSLFLGIVLVVFGLFTQMGFFSGSLRSLSGAGTILISISIIIIAYALVITEFMNVYLAGFVPVASHGSILAWRAVILSDRPYLSLSLLLAESGLAVLVSGIVLKIVHVIRP